MPQNQINHRSRSFLTTAAIVLGATGVFLLSRGTPTHAQQSEKPAQTNYQGQNTNRYQMFFSPSTPSDTFLVDTARGRVWFRRRNRPDIPDLPASYDGEAVGDFSPIDVIRPTPLLEAAPGTYRIYFSPTARRDTFLLDTTSGIVWALAQGIEKPVFTRLPSLR